jgi:hypothetical protein
MNMATHVRILAWFNIVVGGLGVLAACLTFAGASILPAIFSAVAEEAADVPVAVIQFIITAVVGLILVLSLPSLILGFGLYNFRPWARILGFVLAALNLLNVPFGTAVSLYAFWVLLKPETEQLFRQPPIPSA